MKLPKPKCLIVQPFLFPEPLRGHGHIRTVIGSLCERMTAERFQGVRYRTDSRFKYCPDVRCGSMFFETKAVGLTRQVLIYTGRLDKDRDFAEKHSLWYCIWHHRVRTKNYQTVEELEVAIRSNIKALYVVPFSAISDICKDLWPEPLNTAYGYPDSQTYGSGYRFSIKQLTQWMV